MSGIIAQNTLDSSGLVKAPEGGGAWNFIAKQTASADSTISFTSGINSTYKEYVFTFNNIHPSENLAEFGFKSSINTGSGYGVATTTTHFYAGHEEDDSWTNLGYSTSFDLAQGTGLAVIQGNVKNDNDIGVSGIMHLYNPSSAVFVKHFISTTNSVGTDENTNSYHAGYVNTTSAVDAIQFSFSGGNVDLGDICLYGISS
jgi:hypothetical protein